MKWGIVRQCLFLALILVLLPSSLGAPRKTTRLRAPMSLAQQHEVNETLRLLAEGDSQPEDKMGHEDFVLVIGNTGAGKTTMTKFLAQTHLLEAYKAVDRLLITDRDGKISKNSTIVSKTIFPDLIIDKETDTAFYDLPGFQDTRNASVEFANACFIKRVADRAKRVKLLFVLNYSSVRSGESRTDFKTMLEHAVDLVKVPAHFANSTALILTKVESSSTDEEVMAGIEAFLQRSVDDLPFIFPDEDRMTKAFELIESFLTKDEHENLTRIAFFKQPTTVGPLSSMPEMMKQKERIYRVLSNMDYTPKTEDFGISISSTAQLLTSRIVHDLRGRIKSAVNKTAGMMEDFFAVAVQEAQPTDVGRLYELHWDLAEAVQSISPSLTPKQFFEALESSMSPLNLSLGPLLSEMRNREEDLVFFEETQAKQTQLLGTPVPEWTAVLREPMREVKKNIEALGGFLNSKVIYDMANLGQQLERVITSIANTTMDEEAMEKLRIVSAALHANTSGMLLSETYNEFVQHVKAFFPRAPPPDLQLGASPSPSTTSPPPTYITLPPFIFRTTSSPYPNTSIEVGSTNISSLSLNATTDPDYLEWDDSNNTFTADATGPLSDFLITSLTNDSNVDTDRSLDLNFPTSTPLPPLRTTIVITTPAVVTATITPTPTTPAPPPALITYAYTLEEMTPDMSLKDSQGYSSPFRLFHWIRPLEKATRHLLLTQGTVEGRIKDEQHRQTEKRYMAALQNLEDSNKQTLQAEREAREKIESSLRSQKEALDEEMKLQREVYARDMSNRTEEMEGRIKKAEEEKARKAEEIERKMKEQEDKFKQLQATLDERARVLNETLVQTRAANNDRIEEDRRQTKEFNLQYQRLQLQILEELRQKEDKCHVWFIFCFWRG